jgi:hypothetical protein
MTENRSPRIITPTPLDPDKYYTIRELTTKDSPYYQCCPATFFRNYRNNQIEVKHVGRSVIVQGRAITAWIENQSAKEPSSVPGQNEPLIVEEGQINKENLAAINREIGIAIQALIRLQSTIVKALGNTE